MWDEIDVVEPGCLGWIGRPKTLGIDVRRPVVAAADGESIPGGTFALGCGPAFATSYVPKHP